MNKQHIKYRLIEELCEEKGIEKIDLSYDWISILKKGNKQRKIINYNFNLNSLVSQRLADDKYSTYSLLRFYGIPIIEHQVLFNEKMVPNCEEINNHLNVLKNDEKVVIKANHSFQGKDVFVCENQEKKLEIVEQLFEKGKNSVVVSPYLEIEYEYRAIFLDGDIIYIYKKQKPLVVGDGNLNLFELMQRNLKYLKEPLENLDLSYIPKKDEKVIVGWKHNLSGGAIPLIIDEKDEYYKKIKEIALEAGKALDLTYASIDIVVTEKKELFVMEINATKVGITKFCELVPNGFEIGKEIYSKVIDKMFEE